MKDLHYFGMQMPGRNFSSNLYKYGYNGKEKDDEIKGNGNSLDFGARMYDPRLGRFLSVDPLTAKYVPISPYAFSLNNPIYFKDGDGRVVIDANGKPVTISKDDKGNLTFNPDIAPATKELLNYYLKSKVGTAQLVQMDATVTKISIVESEQAAFNYNPDAEQYELILENTESEGSATEKDGTKTYKTSKITIFSGSIDLQSDNGEGVKEDTKYKIFGPEGEFQESGKKILKSKVVLKTPNPGPANKAMSKDKEYAKESTLIHASEHTTANDKKLSKSGGDIEAPAYQKEKELYNEKNPK